MRRQQSDNDTGFIHLSWKIGGQQRFAYFLTAAILIALATALLSGILS